MLYLQAVASAIFDGQLSSSGNAGALISSGGASIDLRALSHLQPLALRQEALRSVAKAIQVRFKSGILASRFAIY